ncbi:MAG: FCD domain-containing protein [Pseudomonadota bacterium]
MDGAQVDEATARLREQLVDLMKSAELGPDGKLPTERALAERFGTGRRFIRQVLDAMEREGLVWRRQGKGTFAGQPADPMGDLAAKITGETNALEVMEARLIVEPELAALCAKRMDDEDIEALRNLAEQEWEAPDPQTMELWDGSIHRLIAQSAGNRPLMTAHALLEKIRSNPDWVALRASGRDAASLDVTYAEHLAIIDAIAARDPDAARQAMRQHLQTRLRALESELGLG